MPAAVPLRRADVHPDLAGEATTSEMMRSFWPFTAGRRRRLGLSLVVSLAQFAIVAALPLLTGHLISSALAAATASDSVEQYTTEWLDRARDTATLIGDLAPGSNDPAGTAAGIRAAASLQNVAAARTVIDDLFPGDLVYDTSGVIGRSIHRQVGESDDDWVRLALDVSDDGSISSAELDQLSESSTVVGERAFDFLVGTLALDDDANAQRHDEQTRLVVTAMAWFVVAVAVLAVVRLSAASLSQRALLGSGRSLQDAVFVRLHDSALLESGAIPRPSMVSRCTSYVDHVVTAVRSFVTMGIPAVMNLLLSIVLLLWIDVRIGLLMLATVAVFEVGRRTISVSWSRTARQQIDMGTAVGEVVDDAVAAERSTRLQRAEHLERRRFTVHADRVRAAQSRVGNYATSVDVGALIVGQFGIVVITAIVGIARSDLSVGRATAAVLYAQAVAAAVAAIPAIVIELQEAAPYMRRLRRVLLSPRRRLDPVSPVPPPDTATSLSLDAVETHDLDDQPVLRGVTFDAVRGRITAVVGADVDETEHFVGVLGGLEITASGRVLVGGVSLAELDRASIGRLVHVVPRAITVFASTLEDNVTLGMASAPSVDEVIHRVGLDEYVPGLHERIASHSSADRRRLSTECLARLGLARAVSSAAEVIIIEDPTRSLDRDAASQWWHLVRSVLEDRIVVIVTDHVDVLADDDEVVVIRSGVVAEVGSRHDLLESGRWFPELWKRWSSSAQAAHDLAALPMLAGLDQGALEAISGRMVTERYDVDEPIFVAGDPADRVFVVLDGRVELTDAGRRIGTVGPGGHFGDFTGSSAGGPHDAVRTTTARARGPVVVRSLHRLAVSSGLLGVLDRTPAEQRLYVQLTRRGESSLDELRAAVPEVDIETTMASLVAAGLVVAGSDDGTYRPASFARRPRLGADRLIT